MRRANEMTLRILITDDDPTLLALSDATLRNFPNLEVQFARNSKECRTALAKNAYDLALLDIELNDGTGGGLDLLGQITKLGLKTRAVMMSTKDDQKTVARCKALGARAFLSKNHDFLRSLLATVRAAA